ncbi:unnamed protein product [Rotaria sp. Silwood1]|nr:unnamed protein product [Rotaria sp. Silwood1]
MNLILSEPTAHCHASNLSDLRIIKLQNEIKACAATTDEASSSILYSALRSFSLSAAVALPRNETLMRTIRRQLTVISSDSTSQLLASLKKTDHGEDFLLYESDELMSFTTKANLSVLKNCKHWFADGTFKMSIKCNLSKVNLWPADLEEDDFEPILILTDFEPGTIKSVQSMFHEVLHKGCLFYFSQCIWRQIQSRGLSTKYQDDEHFDLNVKKLISLAFVLLVDVVKSFDLIAENFDDDAEDFIDYFEKVWIGEPKQREIGQKKPQFEHALWNLYDRVVSDLPRSNNSVEGWHNAFANRVSITHPSIPKLAVKIQNRYCSNSTRG